MSTHSSMACRFTGRQDQRQAAGSMVWVQDHGDDDGAFNVSKIKGKLAKRGTAGKPKKAPEGPKGKGKTAKEPEKPKKVRSSLRKGVVTWPSSHLLWGCGKFSLCAGHCLDQLSGRWYSKAMLGHACWQTADQPFSAP